MQSGVYWGYVGMIEGLVARIKAEYGGPMKVVATGGLAPLFAEGTMVIEPDRAGSHAGRAAHVGGAQPRPHIASRTGPSDRTGVTGYTIHAL